MHSNLRQILVWNWHRSRSCCWMVWNHNGPLWVLSQCTHQQQQRLWWCYEHTQILPYTLCLYVYHKNHTTQIHRHTYQYIISINYSTGSHLVVMGAIHHLRFFHYLWSPAVLSCLVQVLLHLFLYCPFNVVLYFFKFLSPSNLTIFSFWGISSTNILSTFLIHKEE